MLLTGFRVKIRRLNEAKEPRKCHYSVFENYSIFDMHNDQGRPQNFHCYFLTNKDN